MINVETSQANNSSKNRAINAVDDLSFSSAPLRRHSILNQHQRRLSSVYGNGVNSATSSSPKRRGSFAMGSFASMFSKKIINEEPEKSEMSRTRAHLYFIWHYLYGPEIIYAHLLFWAISSAIILCFEDNGKGSFFSQLNTITVFLGGFLSFALVCRTNICYSRWWEGRCLWGSLIYAAINVVQQGSSWIDETVRFHRLACSTIGFAYACKAQLRSSSLQDDGDAPFLIENGILCQEELDAIVTQKGWQPYYFLDVMRAIINQECGTLKDAANTLDVKVAHHMAMEDSINVLSTSIGGMIRVKATGLPQGYNSFQMVLCMVFFVVASVRFTPDIGWWTPVGMGLIYHVIRMILVIGNDMEDPFGTDRRTDLPAELFCEAIHRQIKAVYDRKIILSYDLDKGPKSVSGVYNNGDNSA
eukprot:CAMPEP_0194139680 /NCGR_PEP_ID=MMETSP0152-20130528/9292_1 /TAXON_ID=1049557 /ORGANISM="Thalassiothrix antarctica, Strain L6-D1" /LENGTH=415 /DNA_ID=CAMNT_0038837611 /DNA_START=29 /DNA_END=1276 /DNA_ORIENTATION=+